MPKLELPSFFASLAKQAYHVLVGTGVLAAARSTRGKTIINRFLTPSCRFATPTVRLVRRSRCGSVHSEKTSENLTRGAKSPPKRNRATKMCICGEVFAYAKVKLCYPLASSERKLSSVVRLKEPAVVKLCYHKPCFALHSLSPSPDFVGSSLPEGACEGQT